VQFVIRGSTFPLRVYLKSLGCIWHDYCKSWTTENKDLKKSLRMLGISEKLLHRIKLEKIIEKDVDKVSG
jgi:hypothetical protein